MKRRFLILPALCLTLIFGCDTERRTDQAEDVQGIEEGTEVEEDFGLDTERTAATGMEEEEKSEFVKEIARNSMMEVEASQLAQEMAQSQEVKEYAQMIVNDHQQINEKLRNIAQQENIDFPESLKEDQREEIQDLREKTGSDFDQAYMDKMVNKHEEAIDKLEKKLDEVQDQELQSFIDDTLNALRQHKQEAEQIQEQIGGNEIL